MSLAQQCQPVIWQDDFSQNTLDTNAWDVMLGDGCSYGICNWGNQEEQSYQADNVTVANGIMSIEARKERTRGSQYTSGRIRTANMPASGEWTFGRFEARMKIPDGQGMWPAFWMLPTNPAQDWPVSGEIDIFESVGQSANFSYGTIHYGQPWPDNSHQGGSILMQPGKWSDDFHTYAIEWEAGEIRWYVDNMIYSTKTIADVAPEAWPFDGQNDFHFILNLAVGGTWGGTVDEAALPQTLQVDYVRVYGANQANLSGNHLPVPGSTETYAVINPGSTTTWSVTGGTISGSGATVNVTWDEASANSTKVLTATSGGCEVSTNIYVGKKLTSELILENFSGVSNMTLTESDGIYDVSGGMLTYTRNAAFQWDVILSATSAIPDVSPYILGDKAFKMDIVNTDPTLIGKEILIQLEDRTVSTPSNYPSGRHSSYKAFIVHANGAQTLNFVFADRIDGDTSNTSVDALLVMVDPGNFTSDTYNIDKVEIFGETQGNVKPTSAFTLTCNDLACSFDGTMSTDTDGNIINYSWQFGDNNSATGSNVEHSYLQSGDYTVTLTVTDDQGAMHTTSNIISVVASNNENATSLVVNLVSTATLSAGKGKKYGLANITITDNLGSPVSGVNVSGSFSGTWNESASGVTDVNGIASIQTSTSSSGSVTVSYCVNNVEGSLPYNEADSTGTCP